MTTKRLGILVMLLLMTFLLGACEQLEAIDERADVSRIREAEFFIALQDTVAQAQMPVLFVGMINLLGGWKLRRFGLMLNGFVIGGLMLYTYLNTSDFVQDENTILGMAVVGGIVSGIAAFFLYNLMALLIGGVIGTTVMGGAWLQIAETVPPQLLVFVSTFISAMLMFVVFRLFLVAFSAVIGAVLLMLAVPYETLWVLPVAGLGILMQTVFAWWFNDDIFQNLRGDMGAAVGEAFAEVLGPFGLLRERQRQSAPPAAEGGFHLPRFGRGQGAGSQGAAPSQAAPPHQAAAPRPAQPYPPRQAAPPPQYQQGPAPQRPAAPAQQPYYPPPQQPPPAPPYQAPRQQAAPPPAPPPYAPAYDAAAAHQTQPSGIRTENFQLLLSDGRVFPLLGNQVTVGRNPANTIVVNDAQVSGHHLVFALRPDEVLVWDNNSTNGSYFNGELLRGSRRMTPQDVLQIGAITLRLVRREG